MNLRSQKFILLGAGKDCEVINEEEAKNAVESANSEVANSTEVAKEKEMGPCWFPVIVAKCPRKCPFTGWIHWTEKSMSDRVIASASKKCD
jgi:hypothetical protein